MRLNPHLHVVALDGVSIGKGHYESVVRAAMNAERSLWIATANLKELMVEDERARPGRRRALGRQGEYRPVLQVFEEQVAAGVEIRILHASPPSRPFREELRRLPGLRRPTVGAFEMRACPRAHFKTVIVDGTLLYLGSANWTGAGLGAKGEGPAAAAATTNMDSTAAFTKHIPFDTGPPVRTCATRTHPRRTSGRLWPPFRPTDEAVSTFGRLWSIGTMEVCG